jgi:hypothetical protein
MDSTCPIEFLRQAYGMPVEIEIGQTMESPYLPRSTTEEVARSRGETDPEQQLICSMGQEKGRNKAICQRRRQESASSEYAMPIQGASSTVRETELYAVTQRMTPLPN